MRVVERNDDAAPTAEQLVTLARRRLALEIRALPPAGSGQRRAVLLGAVAPGASFGALVRAIRAAMREGAEADAEAYFVALLKRIDTLNRRWIASTLWKYPASAQERYERSQDLAQDLTLALWERIGLGDDEAWELFFQRALAFAQGHIAKSYLRRQGLWADARSARPERGLALVFSQLEHRSETPGEGLEVVDIAAIAHLDRANLSDLRALVSRLPQRERLAVVMRFWQAASEAEIALALGGVSTRAVRYILSRALRRLRAWYDGAEQEDEHVPDR